MNKEKLIEELIEKLIKLKEANQSKPKPSEAAQLIKDEHMLWRKARLAKLRKKLISDDNT